MTMPRGYLHEQSPYNLSHLQANKRKPHALKPKGKTQNHPPTLNACLDAMYHAHDRPYSHKSRFQ